ncbi:hypothetical protein C8Q78DRAFT_971659 [Trametes maxima]|nr:hypothetical protein C8Q78DRAFT_971659 [Trametes maxima]
MLSTLPTEILVEIVRAMDRDIPTLKSVSLVCRALLPVVHEELFTAVNMHILDSRHSPHHSLFQEIFLRGDPQDTVTSITTGYRFCQAAAEPGHFPKLKELHLVDLPILFYQHLRPKFFHALASSLSITGLTITNSVFIDLPHVQSFICALPNLMRLALCNAVFVSSVYHKAPASMPSFNEVEFNRDISSIALARPRLSRLTISPTVNWPSTDACPEIAQWLGLGPSADSLTTLIIPHLSRNPHVVLRRFGPTVEILSMPLRDLEYSSNFDDNYFGRYTNLHSLTISLLSDDEFQGPWYLLAPFLERGIPGGEALRTIVIDVRIKSQLQIHAAIDWSVLDRVNDALDGDKFSAVEKVVFAVRWEDTLDGKGESPVVDLAKQTIAHLLHDLVDSGKLEMRFQAVKKWALPLYFTRI